MIWSQWQLMFLLNFPDRGSPAACLCESVHQLIESKWRRVPLPCRRFLWSTKTLLFHRPSDRPVAASTVHPLYWATFKKGRRFYRKRDSKVNLGSSPVRGHKYSRCVVKQREHKEDRQRLNESHLWFKQLRDWKASVWKLSACFYAFIVSWDPLRMCTRGRNEIKNDGVTEQSVHICKVCMCGSAHADVLAVV